MKQTLLTLIGLLSLSLAFAQAPAAASPTVDAATQDMLAKVGYQILSSPQDVTTLYNLATGEILIAADAIVSEEVADTLRRAVVERGVALFILTRDDTVDAAASYVKSLAAAGATVRTTETGANFALVDRQWAVVGPMAAGWPKVGVQAPLPLIDPELEAGTDLLSWFYDTAQERRAQLEEAQLAAQGDAETSATGVCEEQLAVSSVAQLLMGTTLSGAPPAATLNDGTTSAPDAPALADPSCYAYAEPTGLTTLIMEPTYVYGLLDGYYQAFVAAEPLGG